MQSCQGVKQCPVLKEYAVKLRKSEANRAFIVNQISHNPHTRVYTAICACCGKTYRKMCFRKKGEGKLFDKLRTHFLQCEICGEWVCKTCFLVWTDHDNANICAKCAQKRDVSGMNSKQYRAHLKKHPSTQDEAETAQLKFVEWAQRRQKQIDDFLVEFDANEPIWGGNEARDEKVCSFCGKARTTAEENPTT